MKILMRTTNPATLSFVQAVLKESDIQSYVFNENMSIMEGSIGAIPRQLMVADDDLSEAIAAMEAMELGHEDFRRA